MKRYKGYYIDGVVFKSSQEIDAFLKNAIIEKIKQFMTMFVSDRYTAEEKMAISNEITNRENRLQKEYGMSASEVEELETSIIVGH